MTSPAPSSRRKVASIQALRGLAALTVAVVHLASGFAYFIDGRFNLGETGNQLASGSVALFFMISGAVMVLSADRLFGSSAGMVTFWRRRLVRVLPPYWIATFLMLGVAVWIGLSFSPAAVGESLALVPQPNPPGPWFFTVFLWPGWTLFYELLFYALFGACLIFGRVRAVVAAGLALAGLVLAGSWVAPDTLLLYAATRPILLLFVPGMVFGLLLHRGFALPAWLRAGALAVALVAIVALDQPAMGQFHNFGYLWWAGLPALMLLIAVLGGPMPLVESRPALAMGDASYAIYLLHVPFAHAWIEVFSRWLPIPGGSIAFLALGLPMLIAVSLAFYRWVERPMTEALNSLLGGRRRQPEPLARSLAP